MENFQLWGLSRKETKTTKMLLCIHEVQSRFLFQQMRLHQMKTEKEKPYWCRPAVHKGIMDHQFLCCWALGSSPWATQRIHQLYKRGCGLNPPAPLVPTALNAKDWILGELSFWTPIAFSSSYVMPRHTGSLESLTNCDTVTQMGGGAFLSRGWLFCKRQCGNVSFSWSCRCVSDMVKTFLYCTTQSKINNLGKRKRTFFIHITSHCLKIMYDHTEHRKKTWKKTRETRWTVLNID